MTVESMQQTIPRDTTEELVVWSQETVRWLVGLYCFTVIYGEVRHM